jgi:hypothetical protein
MKGWGDQKSLIAQMVSVLEVDRKVHNRKKQLRGSFSCWVA